MMKIFAQGKVRLSDLISAKLPLSEWCKGFDLCVKKEALKVLLYPES
jgi:threonine dehydrogenase-like Zn-dependent dehydrogenase